MPTPFQDLADCLARLARREAGGIEVIEIEAARDPASLSAAALGPLRQDVVRIVEVQALLAALAGSEAAVRAMLPASERAAA